MLIPVPGQALPIGKWNRSIHRFSCPCGKETSIPWRRYKQFSPKSCGHCREFPLKDLEGIKFGRLCISSGNDMRVSRWSHLKVPWKCDCGSVSLIRISHVLSGAQTTCGSCNSVGAEWWTGKQFGRLSIRNPILVKIGSDMVVDWNCLCGNVTSTSIGSVTRGATSSCGFCSITVKNWYLSNRALLKSLDYPVHPESVPAGGPLLLEPAFHGVPASCICAICKSTYRVRFNDVKRGKSLSCGCSTNRISKGHLEVKRYIESTNNSVVDEFKIGKYRFDMFVKDSNLLVEFNGFKWHSTDRVIARDAHKYHMASELGYRVFVVHDYEWYSDRLATEQRLLEQL